MWQAERDILWSVTQEMVRDGLVSNYSGNASLRLRQWSQPDLMLITPGSCPYREMRPEDMAVVDLEGDPVEETRMPSSEIHLHLSVYKSRPDVGGVVHTHSLFASVAAVAGLPIPPIVDEMVITLGGEVQVATYAFPGTEELSHRALEALGQKNAVLLRNHGVVGVGTTAQEALEACRLVERVAQVFIHASALGKVHPLPQEVVEMERSIWEMRRVSGANAGGDYADGS